MLEYLERARSIGHAPDATLIDAAVPGHQGGTGTLVAEELLDSLPPLPRLILAGGLHAGNVAERVARVRPWMVDVASGVESSPGRKDPVQVAAFIRAARSVPAYQTVDNPFARG
jgi:phosphoribosylanthranilate isomerase